MASFNGRYFEYKNTIISKKKPAFLKKIKLLAIKNFVITILIMSIEKMLVFAGSK